MLFNSFEFIFAFLPICLIIYWAINLFGNKKLSILWLVFTSLFFYGWWNPIYLLLIIPSTGFNYFIGRQLTKCSHRGNNKTRKRYLSAGIIFNLGLLCYFKYANFFAENINIIFQSNFHLQKIILPLAISFFTFQQIAFLVDAYHGKTKEFSFINYCIFVTFFPQLIAGPIVHHKEMLPQFKNSDKPSKFYENISLGFVVFIFGLFKKVVLADGAASYVTPAFMAAESGNILSFFPAWAAVLAYTFQIYFDFSGYSDMAIGISKMFGINLPINFHSPYKATSIIEFWRRWHITLSRFLRDYVYFSLGGNRKGKGRRYINLMVTMLIGGLWHGAGWTFIFWGMLHGIYLIINHSWRALCLQWGKKIGTSWIKDRISQGITFLVVVVAWVFFRAETLNGAVNILESMIGLNGVILPESYRYYLNYLWGIGDYLGGLGMEYKYIQFFSWAQVKVILLLFLISSMAPNTLQILDDYKLSIKKFQEKTPSWFHIIRWRPTKLWSLIVTLFFIITISYLTKNSEFLYYRF